jgi:hypothetical protein
VLKPFQVAGMLGCSVQRVIQSGLNGTLPGMARVGKRWRFDAQAIQEYLANGGGVLNTAAMNTLQQLVARELARDPSAKPAEGMVRVMRANPELLHAYEDQKQVAVRRMQLAQLAIARREAGL